MALENQVVRSCNRNIVSVLRLSRDMMRLADTGDERREDVSCGVLYGTLRDSAYKLRQLAEQEVLIHRSAGIWDGAGDEQEPVLPRSSDQRGAAVRHRRGLTQERS